jgi:hypothetical protein
LLGFKSSFDLPGIVDRLSRLLRHRRHCDRQGDCCRKKLKDLKAADMWRASE